MGSLIIQPYDGKIYRDSYLYQNASSYAHNSTTKDFLGTGLMDKAPTTDEMYQYRIFAEFDLSSLPVGVNIISAKLCLYHINNRWDAGCPDIRKSPAIYNITEPWTEEMFSLRQPSFEDEYITAKIAPLPPGWLEFDVTQSLKEINSGQRPNYGWVIKNIDDSYNPNWESNLTFISSKDSDETRRPKLVIEYEYAPPNPPTPIEPIGSYKNIASECRFSWKYNGQGGSVQQAFDLQWSTDQVNWTTISQTTSNTYYDAPGGTFPTGNIYWQVRTYNEYDEASEWSDIQSFYAVGAPSAPVISSVSMGTARPTVEWSAFNQQIFQVQVLSGETVVYDSGEIPGVYVRAHKVTAWLPDGSYTMQVRTKNEYDLWSEWGNMPFTVSTSKPTKPSFSAQTTSHGIELHIQNMADYALIYRAEYGSSDFICIGMTAEGYYHDCSVKHGSEYQYFVRSVSAKETYADSDAKLAQAQIRYALLAPVSNLTDIFEFRRALNNPPKRSYTRNPSGSTVEFEGRKYPVWIPTERISAGISLEFFLHSWAEVEKFMSLYDRKETLLYRDARGRKIYGTLSGLAVEEERPGYTVSFVISQVDHDEEVEV
ncbi:MAG: DNRLRE domain-containing protein [Clostridiaceae bacterium]|nr:DNRLRE domain-containing protein [Clostridiaceae bacterium]